MPLSCTYAVGRRGLEPRTRGLKVRPTCMQPRVVQYGLVPLSRTFAMLNQHCLASVGGFCSRVDGRDMDATRGDGNVSVLALGGSDGG